MTIAAGLADMNPVTQLQYINSSVHTHTPLICLT